MEFERETEIMDLKEELISDTIDDAIGEEDDEEVTMETSISLSGHINTDLYHIIIFTKLVSCIQERFACVLDLDMYHVYTLVHMHINACLFHA